MGKKLLEHFIKKSDFRNEKVIDKKGYKLSVKWKGYDDLFYSWVNIYFMKKMIYYKTMHQ